MQTTKSKTGCGCKGSGGCGCKPARLPEAVPAPCSPCDTTSFIRPRFFAGQLLTEDDMSALIDYVVAKQRFHNAKLFGAGVVCGLLVECGPCDSSKIKVQPGYALDCCGNDLVLTCEQTIDVAPMIRELAARLSAAGNPDCTDPCAPPATPNVARKDDMIEVEANDTQHRHYCLYARYAERMEQPVAAYPVGDNCDAASCEPTRIAEGIVFELRCPPKLKHSIVFDEVAECEKRAKELRGNADDFRLVEQWARASAFVKPENKEEDAKLIAAGMRAYDEKLAKATEHRRTLEHLSFLVYVAAPYLAYKENDVSLPGIDRDGLESRIAMALKESTAAKLETLPSRLSIALGHDVTRDLASRMHGSEVLAARSSGGEIESVWTQAYDDLEQVASSLEREVGCAELKMHTYCVLPAKVGGLKPVWKRGRSGREIIDIAGKQMGKAADAIDYYLLDCKCAALNPPCPPCDDTGVLLACFEVDKCKVVRICNTVRQYVLAPTTLRYWEAIRYPYPGLDCCGDKPRRPWPSNEVVDDVRDAYGSLHTRPPAGALVGEFRPMTADATALISRLEATIEKQERRIAKLEGTKHDKKEKS